MLSVSAEISRKVSQESEMGTKKLSHTRTLICLMNRKRWGNNEMFLSPAAKFFAAASSERLNPSQYRCQHCNCQSLGACCPSSPSTPVGVGWFVYNLSFGMLALLSLGLQSWIFVGCRKLSKSALCCGADFGFLFVFGIRFFSAKLSL